MTGPLPHDLDRMVIADAYNASLIERARPWLRGRVLDVGAGVGTHTARLVVLAGQVAPRASCAPSSKPRGSRS